jgi:hypothetical protein
MNKRICNRGRAKGTLAGERFFFVLVQAIIMVDDVEVSDPANSRH